MELPVDLAVDLAVVTGASSGIGEATVRVLVGLGYTVLAGARRLDRLNALAASLPAGRCVPVALDVTNEASVAALAAAVGDRPLHVLVNNAGLSRGLSRLEDAPEEHWRTMMETNVFGVYRVTRALMPAIRRATTVQRASAAGSIPGHAHIVNMGSIAGFSNYVGGSGYAASKHAVRAISQTLRLELVGAPIRVTEINAGLVETEFSIVRFDGDVEAAKKPYAGITPLVAEDIADLVEFAVSRKPHVNIDEIVVKPVRQAWVSTVVRD
jgi:NADP-dependent 3-hydroxy acid dehydrogenase YdfG